MRKFLIVVMSLMMLTTTACSNPFKVTDPSDPKFNPDKFRFEDYPGIPPMTEALKKLFPVGTPKEFVERVLVKAGGAKLEQIIPKHDVSKLKSPESETKLFMEDYYIYGKTPEYILPSKNSWAVGIQFNSLDKIILIELNGETLLQNNNER